MYNEIAGRRDQKLAENWREDANAIMVLSGLIAATVGGFLSQSYLSSQTSSQDVSAFYLAQLYQLQAATSNSSGAPPAPAPPNQASTPTVTHMLWFASLVWSLATAVFATLTQEWVRRYLAMTEPQYSPHKNARIRAFMTHEGSLVILQQTVDSLHSTLHQSILLFLLGLISLTSGGAPSVFVIVIVYVAFPVLKYLWFSLTPCLSPHSLFSTPLSGFLFTLRKIPKLLLSLFRSITRRGSVDGLHGGTNSDTSVEVSWLTWGHAVTGIQKLAESRSPRLDTWAISCLILSLSQEEHMEQFLAGVPGFYRSTRVENPGDVLRESNTDTLPKAILAFMDHSLSSGLVSDAARQQRITVSLKAIQVDSYLLQRTFYHALGSIESTVFTCLGFILLADQHTNHEDPDVRFLTRCTIAVAINRLGDYHQVEDERWAGIIQRALHWSDTTFAEYREQRDSIQLRNLVQLAQEVHTSHPDVNDPFTRKILLCVARQINVENAALGLQHEFCDLWNSLVTLIHDQPQCPAVRSNAMFILSPIRNIYVTLHQRTDSGSSAISTSTVDLDSDLQKASSYILCTVSSHRLSTLTSANANANEMRKRFVSVASA
ncbi:hypothetical protein EI94DRAFT_1794521 [Lactarius quietus]|nr:hypothetical protein EI94DRAFT_1794521 [Lactarius quietus]